MPLNPATLTPYKSLVLAVLPAPHPVTGVATLVCTDIRVLAVAKAGITADAIITPPKQANLEIALFEYAEQRQAPWTTAVRQDTVHHVVVVCRLRRHLAIMATDPTFRDMMTKPIGSADGTNLGRLRRMDRGTLNAAFVKGSTKTLWLTNNRRGLPTIVNSKILAGDDLQYALDPLLDQSFLFSAVRCAPPVAVYPQTIGVSPRKSAVWAGASSDYPSFCNGVANLLDLLDGVVAPVTQPLPFLAIPIEDAKLLATVSGAYDAAIVPMELLDANLLPAEHAIAERWSRLSMTVTSMTGTNFRASVSELTNAGVSQLLGTARFQIDVNVPTRVAVTADQMPGTNANNQAGFDEAVALINSRPTWLRVWYQSGHTFADGAFSLRQLRDQDFPFSWGDFTTFNIRKEKPLPLAGQIGLQKSLFCWVRNRWWPSLTGGVAQGWLACNDGSQEIADFVLFDDTVAGQVTLTLVHVKASKKDTAGRRIALGDFELVVSQAEKNIRFLDGRRLAGELSLFLNAKLSDAVWHDGVASQRALMVNAINAAGVPDKCRVVVVQPRVTKTEVAAARAAGPRTVRFRAIRQLDSLLLTAAATCRGIGAEFVVIGDDI